MSRSALPWLCLSVLISLSACSAVSPLPLDPALLKCNGMEPHLTIGVANAGGGGDPHHRVDLDPPAPEIVTTNGQATLCVAFHPSTGASWETARLEQFQTLRGPAVEIRNAAGTPTRELDLPAGGGARWVTVSRASTATGESLVKFDLVLYRGTGKGNPAVTIDPTFIIKE